MQKETKQDELYHCPVLLRESVEGLLISSSGVYVDVTFGGGGHSREIMRCLSLDGKLYAFDQDEDAQKNVIEDDRFFLIRENFRFFKRFLRLYGIRQVDGILADLGVSSHQFNAQERGFSFRQDAALDLRMNQEQTFSARDLINTYTQEQLRDILKMYGELHFPGRIASAIVRAREIAPIETTFDLKKAVESFAPRGGENQFFAQIFQALRIEVNQELEALKDLLTQSQEMLKEGGRLVVISYHSLEDRLVKNFMKTGNFEGEVKKDFYGNNLSPFKQITRKPLTPSDEEIAANNRSRSAKLRIVEKKGGVDE